MRVLHDKLHQIYGGDIKNLNGSYCELLKGSLFVNLATKKSLLSQAFQFDFFLFSQIFFTFERSSFQNGLQVNN